ncbi:MULTISPECIES: hypothetical protein [Paraburkholderia]|uniref:Uncharacterized protein n=1 Tax=Paraburkholderia madseniana TaxID=2599607 RepID=A0AAP5ERT3_9BURK|nr:MULTISPECIES: hypothetical protein [Paraburkholderia]MCX4150618.1 hypothetical protein [Paraburkholderia madseniana]MDN7153551.1 hypothetical protein [Paraburkholderia sp. WS6]MDQ6412433.1 hypothetical protein [Paraburkholderia madseniana]
MKGDSSEVPSIASHIAARRCQDDAILSDIHFAWHQEEACTDLTFVFQIWIAIFILFYVESRDDAGARVE